MTDEKITIVDFIKLDLRIGTIIDAEEVEESRKLLKLDVDIWYETMTVFACIKKSYKPEDFVGRLVVIVANLKPREMKFGISDGMVLATQDNNEIIIFQPEKAVPPGSKISWWIKN